MLSKRHNHDHRLGFVFINCAEMFRNYSAQWTLLSKTAELASSVKASKQNTVKKPVNFVASQPTVFGKRKAERLLNKCFFCLANYNLPQ